MICRVSFPGSSLKVRAEVSLPEFEEVVSQLPIDIPEVRARLQRWGVELSEDETVSGGYAVQNVGFSFKKFSRGLKKFAKKVAASKAFKLVSKVLDNPLIKALIPPQISMLINIAGAAGKAMSGARAGNPAAIAALASAVDKARGGDPVMARGLTLAAQLTGTKPTAVLKAAPAAPAAADEREAA
jgi:hypothetical protein